jgi:hypothetical protein
MISEKENRLYMCVWYILILIALEGKRAKFSLRTRSFEVERASLFLPCEVKEK